MGKPKKTTYTDIAKAAGVSVSTVSRVLNDRSIVKTRTLDQVLFAMNSLGYQAAPPPMPKSPHKVILVSLPNIGNPFHSEVVKGIQAVAGMNGYKLLVSDDLLRNDSLDHLLYLIDCEFV